MAASKKQKIVCVFCQLPINFFDLSRTVALTEAKVFRCSQNHLIHRHCLEQRLTLSPTCQICGEPYSQEILSAIGTQPHIQSAQSGQNLLKPADSSQKTAQGHSSANLSQEDILRRKLAEIRIQEAQLAEQLQQIGGHTQNGGKSPFQGNNSNNATEPAHIAPQGSPPQAPKNSMFFAEISQDLASAQAQRQATKEKLDKFLLTDNQKLARDQSKQEIDLVTELARKREAEGLSAVETFDPGLDDDFDPLNFAQSLTRKVAQEKESQQAKPKSDGSIPFRAKISSPNKKIPGKVKAPSFLSASEGRAQRDTGPSRPTPDARPRPTVKPIPTVKSIPPATPALTPKPLPQKRADNSPGMGSTGGLSPAQSVPISSASSLSSSVTQPSAGSQVAPQCVICHTPITSRNSNADSGEVICPNEHPAHRSCLKMWIVHSDLCPVCHVQYTAPVLASFSDFKEEHALEQEAAAKRAAEETKRKEQEERLKDINPDFTREYNAADRLMKSGQYPEALTRFWDILDKSYFPPKDQRILRTMLNIGLINYKQGDYHLAIKQLMKIVKVDFQFPLAFYFLGLSYDQLEMPEKAQWALERALQNTEKLAQENPRYEKFIADIRKRLSKIQP